MAAPYKAFRRGAIETLLLTTAKRRGVVSQSLGVGRLALPQEQGCGLVATRLLPGVERIGVAEEEALTHGAAKIEQHLALICVFDAFGHHLESLRA
jgi:hypothetical protein